MSLSKREHLHRFNDPWEGEKTERLQCRAHRSQMVCNSMTLTQKRKQKKTMSEQPN